MNFISRLQRLQNLLPQYCCDCLIVEDPIDLYYMSGMELSRGTLLVTGAEAALFVDGRYLERCQKECTLTVQSEKTLDEWLASHLSPLPESSFVIAFDSHRTTYLEY